MGRWAWLAGAVCVSAWAGPPRLAPAETLHRMLGIALDVASDAQADGLDEVRERLEPLEALAGQLGSADGALAARVKRLLASAHGNKPARIAAEARLLVAALSADPRVVQQPAHPPDLAQGQEVFAQACAACHGADGRAHTAAAEQMSPRPADLTDSEFKQGFSAYRVFNVVSFGVANTPMPGFATLTDAERWAVAAYVLQLGTADHAGPAQAAVTPEPSPHKKD